MTKEDIAQKSVSKSKEFNADVTLDKTVFHVHHCFAQKY